eukprot:Selendium_serpulae@DN5962_c3_g4_i2.p2
MTKGKIAAQCCHAAVGAVQTAPKSHLAQWERMGAAKIVVKVPDEPTLLTAYKKARSMGLNAYIVQDAGRTQIAAGSRTVVAVGPGEMSDIDEVTGEFKLL